MEQNLFKCPKCGALLDLNKILDEAQKHELEAKQEDLLKKLEQDFAKKQQDLEKKKTKEINEAIQAAQKNAEQNFEQMLANSLAIEKMKLEKDRLKEKAQQIEMAKKLQNAEAEKELIKQEQAMAVANAVATEKMRLEKDRLKEQSQQIEMAKKLQDAQAEKELIKQEQARAVAKVLEESRLKTEELMRKANEEHEKKEAELRKQLTRVQSAATSSVSQEVQGEIQEDAVLSSLTTWFPRDTLDEVKKGHTGADILQTVNDVSGAPLGIIAYEIKSTKTFASEWTEKLRKDMVLAKAGLGVLVTEALPAGVSKHGYLGIEKDTLFVCQPSYLPVVAKLARELIKTAAKNRAVTANIADFKERIYQTVTSDSFRQKIISLDGYFKKMKEDLEKHNRHNIRFYRDQTVRLEALVTGLLEIESDIGAQLPQNANRPLLEESDDEEDAD